MYAAYIVLNALALMLYMLISAGIISFGACLLQFVKKAVIPAIMELPAPRARVHIDQYQGMQLHLTTVRVSYLTRYNCYAINACFHTDLFL